MTPSDVEEISQIHMSSWDKRILLTKMGFRFVRDCFYEPLVRSRYGFGFVAVKDKRIIGYATGFSNFPAFVKSNPNMLLGRLIALWRLITFKVSINDLLDAMNEGVKYRKLRDPKFQLSAVALRNEYKGTPEGKVVVTKCLEAVLRECKKRHAKYVWGDTYKENIPMQKYFYKLGFLLVEEIKLRGRVMQIFEKAF